MLPPSPFTRADAADHGVRPFEWRSLIQDGYVREVYPSLYVDASLPDTVTLRFAIMQRVLPAGRIVARRSAAWLSGLDVLDRRGYPRTPPVEVLTTDQRLRSRSPLISAHVADDLTPSDIVEMNGLAVTSPLRTCADLARFSSRSDALVAVDGFMHHQLVTLPEFKRSLVRWRKRRGVRQAWEMSEITDAGSESGGESRLRLRVLDMGLPRPELQIPVHDMYGVERYRLDLGWLRWWLALEYDGEEHHGEDRREHDEARRSWISGRGWTVRAFRKEDIFTSSRHFEDEVEALVTQARAA